MDGSIDHRVTNSELENMVGALSFISPLFGCTRSQGPNLRASQVLGHYAWKFMEINQFAQMLLIKSKQKHSALIGHFIVTIAQCVGVTNILWVFVQFQQDVIKVFFRKNFFDWFEQRTIYSLCFLF